MTTASARARIFFMCVFPPSKFVKAIAAITTVLEPPLFRPWVKEKGTPFRQYVEISRFLKRFRLILLYMTQRKSQVHPRRFSNIYHFPLGRLVHYAETSIFSAQTYLFIDANLSYQAASKTDKKQKWPLFSSRNSPSFPFNGRNYCCANIAKMFLPASYPLVAA